MKQEYSLDFLLSLYRTMLRIRLVEESFVEPILSKEIRCPVHLYSGEEAIGTGVCASLDVGDCVFGSHRSHGHYLAKGGDLDKMVAEIFCRGSGCAAGRGGSMHIIDPSVGMLGAAPIVAGTISLAVGAAYAARVRGEDRVSVSFFGDGAAGEGVLYESMNLASVRRLPVFFVCENNFYSTHLPIRECRVSEEIWRVAEPFNIWTRRVDGNDVLAVLDASREAVGECRKGNGPAFLECLTYRLRGHVGPNDNIQGSQTDIRPQEEIEAWRARDPLELFRHQMINDWRVKESRLEEIQDEVRSEVESAIARARQSHFPSPKELAHHVFF